MVTFRQYSAGPIPLSFRFTFHIVISCDANHCSSASTKPIHYESFICYMDIVVTQHHVRPARLIFGMETILTPVSYHLFPGSVDRHHPKYEKTQKSVYQPGRFRFCRHRDLFLRFSFILNFNPIFQGLLRVSQIVWEKSLGRMRFRDDDIRLWHQR